MGAAFAVPAAAEATTFTVDTTADGLDAPPSCADECTLREAFQLARDSSPNPDQILFESGLSGTITLQTGAMPMVDHSLTVTGPGANVLAVSGADNWGILKVEDVAGDANTPLSVSGLTLKEGVELAPEFGAAVSAKDAVVTIQNATLTGNYAGPAGGVEAEYVVPQGGAIYTKDSQLAIRNSTISDNRAGYGGGVWAEGGTVSIQGSRFAGNRADLFAYLDDGSPACGAVGASHGTTVTVEGSVVTGNLATTRGGGLCGVTTVRNSTIIANQVTGTGEHAHLVFGGGGISGAGTIDRSTIVGNESTGDAGGISGVASIITRSTVSTNYAADDGGGIRGTNTTITGSTISGNIAGGEGGGIYAGASHSLRSTIVANNSASVGADIRGENFTDAANAAFSLIESTSGAPLINHTGPNVIGVDPKLGVLASNGGPTQTHALAATSPAIDRGSATGPDQRGFTRPLDFLGLPNAAGGNGADIGAFELQASSCRGQRATTPLRNATGRRDVIIGTSGRDVIRGLGGNDLVCGGGGNDLIVGGRGKDTLLGEAGKDKLKGGALKDKLIGGPGRDTLIGGSGPDKLKGGPGRDVQRQ